MPVLKAQPWSPGPASRDQTPIASPDTFLSTDWESRVNYARLRNSGSLAPRRSWRPANWARCCSTT